MQTITDLEAKQDFSRTLDIADSFGQVFIRRENGKIYSLLPAKHSFSPLDIPSIKVDIPTEEIVDIIRKERERSYNGTNS